MAEYALTHSVSYLTFMISTFVGQIMGGILNAWFGNVVEMLLCVAAIRANELLVVKATLVGSILSNLLLVTGCSFLFGGFIHKVRNQLNCR